MKCVCKNDFYLRFTSKPFQDYKNYLQNDDDNFKKYINENMKNEIKFSSQSLYYNYFIEKKYNNKIKESLFKYGIRATTRTTPYSLLAGVMRGYFNEKEQLDFSKINFHIRVDMEWLLNVIPILEKDINNELFIIVNPNILIEKERIINNWSTCFFSDDNFDNENIVINNTKAVKIIFQYCKEFIRKSELVYYVQQYYPQISKKIIERFIDELLKYEILISNLHYSLVNVDYLNNIAQTIRSSNYTTENTEIVLDIKQKIDYINSSQDLEICEELENNMKNIFNSSNYFHMDLYSQNKICLSKKIQEDIKEYYTFLLYFSKLKNIYGNYMNKFIDKYGYSFVPANIVLDDDIGLGIPDEKDFMYVQEHSFDTYLLNKLINNFDESSIDIYDDLPIYNSDNVSSEGEIALFVLKSNDKYEYVVSPMIGSDKNDESYGRFRYLFSDIIQETNRNKDYVEITYMPKKARIANVLNCQSKSNYILSYGSGNCTSSMNRINLSDILISVKNNHFIFVNKLTNKEINFTYNNKTNILFMPKELHFLLTASNNKKSILTFYNELYDLKNKMYYLPEIRFKNFIISPRCWNINQKIFINDKIISFNQFLEFIASLVEKYHINNDIYLEYADNRLLFNLKNKKHLEIIYNLCKNNKKLCITESLFDEKKLILKKGRKKYIAEFIFQVSNNIEQKDKFEIDNAVRYISNPLSQRIFYPFDKWIYVIINIRKENQNYFLVNYLYPFLKGEQIKKKMYQYFYLRYVDNKPSIRLRINTDDAYTVLRDLNDFLKNCIDNQIVITYSYSPYEREIERYGDETISTIENLFYLNSNYTLDVIKEKEMKLVNYTYEEIFIITFIKFLFDIKFKYIYTCFRDYVVKEEYRKEFRIIRNKILPILCNDFNWGNLREQRDGIKIYIYSEKYHMKNRALWKYIDTICDKSMQESIISSIAHMFFNRIIGIDRKKEIKIMSYIANLIRSLEGREKYGKSKDTIKGLKKDI